MSQTVSVSAHAAFCDGMSDLLWVKEVNGQKFTGARFGTCRRGLQPHLRATAGESFLRLPAKLYPLKDIFWLAFSFFGRERFS